MLYIPASNRGVTPVKRGCREGVMDLYPPRHCGYEQPASLPFNLIKEMFE